MTPLDSSNGGDTYIAPSWDDDVQPVSLSEAKTLAEGLKAAREHTGRSLDDLSDATRVRKQYLIALEEGAYDRLPSRPFSTGYVRAYARALGLDEETAADRFKSECPDASTQLRAPVGSELDDVKPRHTGWVVAAMVLISAVVVWNVVQHVMTGPKKTPSDLVRQIKEQWTTGLTPGEPIRVAAPLAPPKDQSVPAPYKTPGIESQLASLDLVGQPQAPKTDSTAVIPAGAAFNPKGAIYGSASDESLVTFQARGPVLITLRSAEGVVYFAHQLAAGEAYRAPLNANLQVDVSDPAAVSVYLNGEYHGPLHQTITPLPGLNSQREQAPAQTQAAAPATPNTGG
jgi:cytoskeletal protein RodZ